jgi:S1-C subfamily serine protease/beta-lactamase regulating signal transducer with metallopeptidase domain
MITLLDTIGPAVWRASWQAAALALLVVLLLWCFGERLSPRWRFLLWSVVLARLLLLATPGSPWSMFNLLCRNPESSARSIAERQLDVSYAPVQPTSDSATGVYGTDLERLRISNSPPVSSAAQAIERVAMPSVASGTTTEVTPPAKGRFNAVLVTRILSSFWLAGCLLLGLKLLTTAMVLRRRLSACRPVTDAILLELLETSRRRIGLTCAPALLVTPECVSPCIVGTWKPRLVLPESIVTESSAARLGRVLTHELAHLRRADLWMNWLLLAARTLHWFNPVAWWMVRQMRAESEAACDELALAALGEADRSAYAATIVELAASLAPSGIAPGLIGLFSSTSGVKARVEHLLRSSSVTTLRTPVAAGLLLVIALMGLTDAMPDVQAQAPKEAASITAVTSLTTERVHADDEKRIDTGEKTHSISAAMESSLEGLPKLYESVSKSIVRLETTDNISATGVIVSSDGHILVGHGVGLDDVKVHLSNGRTVTAKAAGWSLESQLAVMKINEKGPWPAIELGSTKDLKAGELCLVIGYSPRGDTKFDPSPTARSGFIDRSVPTRWFTTTCFPGFFEWAAVVGMDGRLLGINNYWAGDQSYETAVDVFVANRDALFAGKNLDWVRYPPNPDSIYRIGAGDHPEMLRMRKTDDVLGTAKPPVRMSESELSEVKQIAKKTTVRLVSKDRLGFDGKAHARWSGVIVSEDGYILTCAHTEQLPGEKLTVRLSDGRDADAVALGTNPITDIGLVKITTPGSWPFAEIAESSTLKPGDPLVVAGYPAAVAKGEPPRTYWLTERTPEINETAVRHTLYMTWGDKIDTDFTPLKGGMSGGGVFNRYGRYVAAFLGDCGTRSEVAKVQWEDLKRIESIDTATGMPHRLRKRFVAPSKAVAQSVVELLVDSKSVSIGTIVDADGWILTKASVLDGKVSCRLPDQSVVIAEKRAESQEHDLALLKIDVGGLSAAAFSDQQPPSIAQALCAVGPGQILKPGIVSIETRAIPPEPRWKGDATEDTPDGPMISRSSDGHLGWQNKTNLSTVGTKLQVDDIIVSINGHSTPNIAALTQVLETDLAGYCTGDLVSVGIRRKGAPVNVLTPLPPATVVNYWMMDKHDTPRRSGFAAVLDTDIELLQREVGGPVIDVDGRIRGVAIASRGRNETQRSPTSVLPSHVVSRVTTQLMAEAHSE